MAITRWFQPFKWIKPVHSVLCGVMLLAAPAVGLSDDPTFKDILKRAFKNVNPEQWAILTIAASAEQRVKGAPATYSYFDIQIKDKRLKSRCTTTI